MVKPRTAVPAPSGQIVASWRHFGWELEIEKNGRWPSSIYAWRRA